MLACFDSLCQVDEDCSKKEEEEQLCQLGSSQSRHRCQTFMLSSNNSSRAKDFPSTGEVSFLPLMSIFTQKVNLNIMQSNKSKKKVIVTKGNCNPHLENSHLQMGAFETELNFRSWIKLILTKLH